MDHAARVQRHVLLLPCGPGALLDHQQHPHHRPAVDHQHAPGRATAVQPAIYIFLVFNFAYSENIELKMKEDVEIENLESQIKVLENKIQTIKKLKSDKNKNDLKVALVLSGGGAKRLCSLRCFKSFRKGKY